MFALNIFYKGLASVLRAHTVFGAVAALLPGSGSVFAGL